MRREVQASPAAIFYLPRYGNQHPLKTRNFVYDYGMATSAATHLADVDAAISATLAGQVSSYSIASRSLQRFSLTELFAIRDKLKSEVNHASGASIRLAKMGKPNP